MLGERSPDARQMTGGRSPEVLETVWRQVAGSIPVTSSNLLPFNIQ